jgi:hypothetical protein
MLVYGGGSRPQFNLDLMGRTALGSGMVVVLPNWERWYFEAKFGVE